MITVFVALPDGLLALRRASGAWQVERPLDGLPVQCVAADPLWPERLYCGTFGRGLWRSTDAGATWQPLGKDFRSSQVMALAISPNERTGGLGTVYAGTEATALYRSDDGGDTWTELTGLLALPSAPSWSFPPRPYTSHVRAIGCDPNAAGRLYVAVEAGALARSEDGGATWVDRVPGGPFDTHTLALPAAAPGLVYSAAGDGFFMSRDAGVTWTTPDAGLRHHYCWAVAADSGDSGSLVLSAASGPRAAHDAASAASTVYRRSAGGDWQPVTAGLPPERGTLASSLVASPVEPHVFYAANNYGVYQSDDAGTSWRRLDIPWPERAQSQRPEGMVVVDL